MEASILASLHHDIFVPNVHAVVGLALKDVISKYFTKIRYEESEENIEDMYHKAYLLKLLKQLS